MAEKQSKTEDTHTKSGANGSRHAKPKKLFPRKKPYIALILLMGVVGIAFLVVMTVVDLLPDDLAIILAAISVAMIAAASITLASEKKWKRVLGVAIAAVFLFVFGFFTYFMTDAYATLNTVSVGVIKATGPIAKRVNITEEPFNLYITGIDQWEEEDGLDLERSDVNMIITVNPLTKRVLMTSIPRDSYVKLHTAQEMDKLTHTGIYGVDETLKTVEDWLGIDLNYYVKINFTATLDLIQAIGGIDVYSPVAFEGSLQGNEYKQGWNHLSGWDALYFARERKAFEGKDEIRVENQQRVMQAIIKKLTSSSTILSNYGDIMAAAGKNLTTNVSTDEMLSLVKMQLSDLSDWDVESQKISGTEGMDYVASLTQSQKFSVYYPDDTAVENAKKGIDNIMNATEEELKEAGLKSERSFLVNVGKSLIERLSVGSKDVEEE